MPSASSHQCQGRLSAARLGSAIGHQLDPVRRSRVEGFRLRHVSQSRIHYIFLLPRNKFKKVGVPDAASRRSGGPLTDLILTTPLTIASRPGTHTASGLYLLAVGQQGWTSTHEEGRR
jgi:hypothetical protein